MDAVTPKKWTKPTTRPETASARFHAKWIGEPNSGCWLWLGGLSANKYGSMHDGERMCGAHHFSYRLHHGLIPKGMFVCHSCDTPICVNPDHLFLDTPCGNQADMVKKGRARAGNPEWWHSEELRKKVQQDPRPYRVIAEEYGLKFNTVKAFKSAERKGDWRRNLRSIRIETARLRAALQQIAGMTQADEMAEVAKRALSGD